MLQRWPRQLIRWLPNCEDAGLATPSTFSKTPSPVRSADVDAISYPAGRAYERAGIAGSPNLASVLGKGSVGELALLEFQTFEEVEAWSLGVTFVGNDRERFAGAARLRCAPLAFDTDGDRSS